MDIYSKLNLWWICLHMYIRATYVWKNQHILSSLVLSSIHKKYLSYIRHDMYCIFIYAEIVSCSSYSWSCSAPSTTPPLQSCVAACYLMVFPDDASLYELTRWRRKLNWIEWSDVLESMITNDTANICLLFISHFYLQLKSSWLWGAERPVSLNKTDFKAHTIYMYIYMTFRSFIMSSPILPTSLIETSYRYLASWKKTSTRASRHHPQPVLWAPTVLATPSADEASTDGEIAGAWIACQYQHPEN